MSKCAGNKNAFDGLEEVKKHIQFLKTGLRLSKSKSFDHKKSLRPYQCDICGLWHMTSQSKAEMKRLKRSWKK